MGQFPSCLLTTLRTRLISVLVFYYSMCAPGECGARGCEAKGVEDPNSDKIVIDSRFISKQVRSILKTGKPDYVPLPSYILYDP